ncbi:hypothetical protein GPALN_002240 [Globodera pallida]|nr:hypothetical protein GPALN_002240 [Globodera pallida]
MRRSEATDWRAEAWVTIPGGRKRPEHWGISLPCPVPPQAESTKQHRSVINRRRTAEERSDDQGRGEGSGIGGEKGEHCREPMGERTDRDRTGREEIGGSFSGETN